MKTYIIILSDLPDKINDINFANFVNRNKLEYWRHTALTWILATPETFTLIDINQALMQCYGMIFQITLEVKINDITGVYSIDSKDPKRPSPFDWFTEIKSEEFVPRWERNDE